MRSAGAAAGACATRRRGGGRRPIPGTRAPRPRKPAGGVRVRRVRYASARRETLAYRGTMADALRKPGGWRALAGLWRALRRAAREEVAAGADLVHAHWWVPAGLAAPPDVSLVITVHG